jgi:hypothetical protein
VATGPRQSVRREGAVCVASAAAIVPQPLSLCPHRSPPLPMPKSYQTRHQVLGALQGWPAGGSEHTTGGPHKAHQQRKDPCTDATITADLPRTHCLKIW